MSIRHLDLVKILRIFFKDLVDFLQTDDYSGYNSVENVTRVGCLAHARRYYTDALKALPKEAQIESTYAHAATKFFQRNVYT